MAGSLEWSMTNPLGGRLYPITLPRPRSTYNMSNQNHNEWRREVIDLDRLRSPSAGLGFTITGRQGEIYVKRIFRNGLAHMDGRLKSGDKIVKIGDQQLTGTDLVLAVTLMRTSPNPVVLTVERGERNNAVSGLPDYYAATNRLSHHRQSLPNVMYSEVSGSMINLRDPSFTESPPPSYEEAVSLGMRFSRLSTDY